MQVSDAAALLAAAIGPTDRRGNWADLGCGRGVFTRALAGLLAQHSTVHAIDGDARVVASLPARVGQVEVRGSVGDFTESPWPFSGLDGVLMANSLHYVADQLDFVRRCAPALNGGHRFVIVEYDMDEANRWVPYPLNRQALARLFATAGYTRIEVVGTRPSLYRRNDLYCALVTR